MFADGTKESRTSGYLAGILIQEMIWQRSAGSLILHGPPKLCKYLAKCYSEGGKGLSCPLFIRNMVLFINMNISLNYK